MQQLVKMNAEDTFKFVVKGLIVAGIYPSPRWCNLLYDEVTGNRKPLMRNSISGKQCKWRREVCKELNFTLNGLNLGEDNILHDMKEDSSISDARNNYYNDLAHGRD